VEVGRTVRIFLVAAILAPSAARAAAPSGPPPFDPEMVALAAQVEDPAGQQIASPKIAKKPGIELELTQCRLNCRQVEHRTLPRNGGNSRTS
jgi:hypothetical protein